LSSVFGLAGVAHASGGTVDVKTLASAPLDAVSALSHGCSTDPTLLNLGEFWMSGPAGSSKPTLLGCWYTTSATVFPQNPAGEFKITGTEHFVGCIDMTNSGSCGANAGSTFDTTFVVWLKAVPGTFNEIHGHCHHPITPGSGTGQFANATGVIEMHDEVTSTEVTSIVDGPIQLG
jgi:hypothetical protein